MSGQQGHLREAEVGNRQLATVSRLQRQRLPRARDPGRRTTRAALIVGASADKDD